MNCTLHRGGRAPGWGAGLVVARRTHKGSSRALVKAS